MDFCQSITESDGVVSIAPGESHWSIFAHLLRASRATGNLVPDAWFASLAVEHGCTWAATDREYSRFPGLKLPYPLRSGL